MGLFNNRHGSRSDVVVTLFALLAIVLAGGISIATISTEKQADPFGAEDLSLTDPVGKAETAALAGIDAARGHIECHGITESGGLPGQYYANGARFEVAWDKINLADSTVHIVSTGFMSQDDGKIFSSIIESVHKVDFLASHDRPVLHEYYQGNAQPTHFNSSN